MANEMLIEQVKLLYSNTLRQLCYMNGLQKECKEKIIKVKYI